MAVCFLKSIADGLYKRLNRPLRVFFDIYQFWVNMIFFTPAIISFAFANPSGSGSLFFILLLFIGVSITGFINIIKCLMGHYRWEAIVTFWLGVTIKIVFWLSPELSEITLQWFNMYVLPLYNNIIERCQYEWLTYYLYSFYIICSQTHFTCLLFASCWITCSSHVLSEVGQALLPQLTHLCREVRVVNGLFEDRRNHMPIEQAEKSTKNVISWQTPGPNRRL